jgi:ribosomal protection tetracycline resistance protein
VRTLNLGILAHVDAGKTTLTERLLFAAGVIDEIGSVDDGSTQTDSLPLERRRGITIKSAVVSFAIDDVTVNLIDTPGHPDFIAEVERVLSILDGAVLVISAVEGVQAQTRVLMRTLQRLKIPTVIFVNKIDRMGARCEHVIDSIASKLTPSIVQMGAVSDIGTRDAAFVPFEDGNDAFLGRIVEALADADDALLAAFVGDSAVPEAAYLRAELAAQAKRALVHPVFFGSAATGSGIEALMSAILVFLPQCSAMPDEPLSGVVFKIERGLHREKTCYVRMFSGTLRTRDRLALDGGEQKVTAIHVFERGSCVQVSAIAAGQIAMVWGLTDVRIGDAVGASRANEQHQFPPPTLESVIVPRRANDRAALRVALDQLEEQDPLINLRQDDVRRETYVSLYGEVQKEVIQETLALDYGIDVEFRGSTTICIERPIGEGAAFEIMFVPPNPFIATVGLRIEPLSPRSGVEYGRSQEVLGKMPPAFFKAVEDTVYETLAQGLCGWQVTDCKVTVTHAGIAEGHASTAADFRNLTPLVLMSALRQAGTAVCEPFFRFTIDVPEDVLPAVLRLLAKLEATTEPPCLHGQSCTVEGQIAAARAQELQRQIPGITRGEGTVECTFDSYQPVRGAPPMRPRTDHNPLVRREYLLHVVRRV